MSEQKIDLGAGPEFTFHYDDSARIDTENQETKINDETIAEMRELAARYPQPKSALLPILHLIQSVDGYITDAGMKAAAEVLDISLAHVNGVATFYTQYHRKPAGEYHVGVCTTTLCGVMGGDVLLNQLEEKLGIEEGETTPDGKISLERLECNAACDFAPVMMVNWEFMDQMTPAKADKLIEDLRAGKEVHSTRGPKIGTFKENERVLAGFYDGKADEGPSAGEASLRGLTIAKDNGWAAPTVEQAQLLAAEKQSEEGQQ